MLKRLIILIFAVQAFGIDCNLPYDDPPIECCAEKWGGDVNVPEIAFVVFQGIYRTDRSPEWVMTPIPNNRVFILRLYESEPPSLPQSKWSYNLDAIGGEGGVESDIWVVQVDLLAWNGENVILKSKVEFPNPPSDMYYFYDWMHIDCRTVYYNQLAPDGYFQAFFAGGIARIFWFDSPNFGDFNEDGIVDFADYTIFVAGKGEIPIEYVALFARNWLKVFN